jgi:hypothetical protein
MTTPRPIPPEITMAETCFIQNWNLERARQFAKANDVRVHMVEEDEDDGLVSFTFYPDHSVIHFRKDIGDIFGIELVYDVNVIVGSEALGNLDFPQ